MHLFEWRRRGLSPCPRAGLSVLTAAHVSTCTMCMYMDGPNLILGLSVIIAEQCEQFKQNAIYYVCKQINAYV